MISSLVSIGTGVTVSLIVFFVTRFYSSTQAKKAADMERKETERLETAKANSAKIDALTTLCCATAQHKIVRIGNEYIRQGAITSTEISLLEDIYKPYCELGWNNHAEDIMEVVEKLPRVTEV